MISKIRSPDAVARCDWPIHIPSARSGDDEDREIEVERDEAARRQRAVDHHPGADEEHCRLCEQRHERDQRDVERALPVRAERLVEDELRADAELLLLGRLLRERLDDVHADDVLLRDGRDVGEPLLHVAQRRMRDVAVAVGEHDEERRDGEQRSARASTRRRRGRSVTETTVSTFWKKKMRP